MKKIILLTLLVIVIVVTGCEKENSSTSIRSPKKTVHEHCTRAGIMEDGEVSLQYDLYYTGERLNILQSFEQVTSSNENTLDTYEQAYKGIHAHYKGLEYYDADVVRENTSVTSRITINYDKINLKKLLEIEGADDNIVENGIPKVAKWKELAERFGTSCQVIE